MSGSFVIDCYAENRETYPEEYAVIAIDVIRATTTATTALFLGREVYPSASADDAIILARSLKEPLRMGEMGGHVPYGFDLTNSPVQVTALTNIPSGHFTNGRRPLILVSSSGTPLIMSARNNKAVYLACLRNYKAVAAHVAGRYDKIAIIGAGTRGEFRREDQIGCAWVGHELKQLGYEAENSRTDKLINKWHGCDHRVIRQGNSAKYLERSGQMHDLEFILHHVNDLIVVPKLVDGFFEDAKRIDY